MYAKKLAECFPSENLPRMYECEQKDCFYDGTLFKHDEVIWKHQWCKVAEDLTLQAFCPACVSRLVDYEDE